MTRGGRRRTVGNEGRRAGLPRSKRVAFTLTALSLPLLLFGALEAGLRLAGAGYPASFFIPAPGTDGFTTNARFGWRFFPPALARTPLVAWLPAEKSAASFRICVLGESAAMGVPEPAFGFSRMLDVMLAEAYPGLRVEMVNTAMTAINSHVIREIAEECARHRADLFILYLGNNEVVGPFGPATIFTRTAPPLPLIRARLLIDRTRAAQVLGARLRRLTSASSGSTKWRGMEMLTEERIAADDPRLTATYGRFRRNLDAILDTAAAAEIPAVVATVATNLRDMPPFASAHGRTLTDAERGRFEAARRRGLALESSGRHAEAAGAYREAVDVDDGHAEARFRLGAALLADGQAAEAVDQFVRARDLDVLRFRADSGINRVIRAAVQDRLGADGRVALVDVERAFAATSGGAPGDDLFWEHVHLTPEGNYQLAREMFAQVASIVERRQGGAGAPPPAPSPGRVQERLALTAWDRLRMASGIFEMMKRPPFVQQPDHELRLAERRRIVAELRSAARAEGETAGRVYRDAIAHRPHDLHLRAGYATWLRERSRLREAADEWRAMLARLPGVVDWRAQLAFALSDEAAMLGGDRQADRTALLAEAEALLRGIADEQPELPAAHVNLGTVLERQGRPEAAAAEYETALRLQPGHETAQLNLAALAAARGDLEEAVALYRAAIALDPLQAEGYARLGGVLERQQRAPEAVAAYRQALELDPDLARVRNTLAYALERQGATEDAIAEYRRAIASDPDYTVARLNLADLLMRGDRAADALEELRALRAREPDHPAALMGEALVLATADARRLRDAQEAIRLAERAAAVTGGSPEALRTLAIAYAAAGRLEEAIVAAARGADVARARSNAGLAAVLDEQVRAYRARVHQ